MGMVTAFLKYPCKRWQIIEPALSAIPVTFFTASAGASQQEKALMLRAFDYLIKPSSAAKLKRLLPVFCTQRV